jgi:hypothetical protein
MTQIQEEEIRRLKSDLDNARHEIQQLYQANEYLQYELTKAKNEIIGYKVMD